ncbi:hypothetical protein KGP24_23900 (plasmid) [Enterobacter sp. JBIWA008]|uniref:hypothetical protein n=1 Tax=unclassified Enterobacter TaxID=2608935 RepID=UPI0015FC9040|nr:MULTISPECIES: hypothetical protein [unclassified Enterobacter]MBA7754808.1 hypothetical protein [Enterobacter sp. RHBSTW-01064]MCM7910237.1 hypothetical protein [Enterobacter hormaechei]UAN43423.1 hypothetical protein KGP24_23900 [Enterobacter sp. JBIWA008]
MTPNIQAYRADGGDIGTDRIKEIANNPYGDEEKCWLAKRVLALLDELEAKDKAWSAQDNHINQQADRIESLEKKNGELGRALGAAEKLIAELQARDITIKQHAQALFEAIANPSDHYVPAYARCLREALNGTSTGKGE